MTYIDWFNNESGEGLLQAWGVETKAKGEEEKQVPKVCPECMANNRLNALMLQLQAGADKGVLSGCKKL